MLVLRVESYIILWLLMLSKKKWLVDFILRTIKFINDINTKVVARGFRFSYNLDLLASVIWRHRSVREREAGYLTETEKQLVIKSKGALLIV